MGGTSPWHWMILLLTLGLVAAGVYGIAMLIKNASKSAQPYSGPAITPVMAPGWYADPNDSTLLRYFDGQAWTASTKPKS